MERRDSDFISRSRGALFPLPERIIVNSPRAPLGNVLSSTHGSFISEACLILIKKYEQAVIFVCVAAVSTVNTII
jgi:hypothetical protein